MFLDSRIAIRSRNLELSNSQRANRAVITMIYKTAISILIRLDNSPLDVLGSNYKSKGYRKPNLKLGIDGAFERHENIHKFRAC